MICRVLEADLIPAVIKVLVRSRELSVSSLLLSSVESLSMRAESRRGRVATITHYVKVSIPLEQPEVESGLDVGCQPGGTTA